MSQVRNAIFHIRPTVGRRATLRTAVGNLNGVSVDTLASSNAALNSAAVDFMSKWQTLRGPNHLEAEPGTTPQSHEILMTIIFFGSPK